MNLTRKWRRVTSSLYHKVIYVGSRTAICWNGASNLSAGGVMRTCACLFAALLIANVAVRAQETVYTPGDGVSIPAVIKQVKPEYTPEAKENRIEGSVRLSAVVQTD